MTSLVDAESVLAIDIGSVNTRALLFDVVDGLYHFIASAVGPTTAGAPYFDISEGVHLTLLRLQEVTGRTLVDTDARLIIPAQSDGSGVDRLALTSSAGPDLKVVTLGLLSDVSLQSAQRLAGTNYTHLVDHIGLNDRRKQEAQLDALLQARPDIVIVAGGTERGATRSVSKMVELVAMACRVLPRDSRPKVLYCGNSGLAKRVKENLERDTAVVIAPNIRPTIDLEDLTPAGTLLSKMVAKLRTMTLSGLEGLSSLCSMPMLPSATALGRMMRFMAEMSSLNKPSIGVDLGASATTLAVGTRSGVKMNVFRNLGMGGSLQAALRQMHMSDILQWVPYEVTEDQARDHLVQKAMFPASLPLTTENLAVEQGAARQILRTAAQRMLSRYPSLDMSFEYVFISGAALTQARSLGQTLFMVLDGLQPVGVNVFMLDPYGLSQALGAIAAGNALLPTQILDSGAYINLATVLCPVSDARPGAEIMKIKISYDEGNDTRLAIKQGTLTRLPIRHGQTAHLQVESRRGTVLDPAAPRLNKGLKVVGGACGVIVDTRGRPIMLPENSARQQELLNRWYSVLE